MSPTRLQNMLQANEKRLRSLGIAPPPRQPNGQPSQTSPTVPRKVAFSSPERVPPRRDRDLRVDDLGVRRTSPSTPALGSRMDARSLTPDHNIGINQTLADVQTKQQEWLDACIQIAAGLALGTSPKASPRRSGGSGRTPG
mmetsp:Transcript_31492/g.68041  ORF Transcript_31492/g.68041 Transcript_31492/m.68041 type:complete len:141 (+) Transcript_31492:170-592(+)